MTIITTEEAQKLAHKYRFANNDLERVLCETASTVIDLHQQLADAKAAQSLVMEMEAKLVEALEALRHAVCGETGFASCVRANSGKAYPWPALDEAEALANAALAEVQARD